MKTLVTLLSVLVAFSAASADARSIRQDYESAEIIRSNIDAKSHLINERLDGTGQVYINRTTNKATLKLGRKFYCPPNQVCAEVMPEPVVIELPIIKINAGECNSVIYVAQIDKRPVDGMYEGLRITDNRRFYETCRTVRAIDPTVVEYKTISPGMDGPAVETNSTFVAKPLKRPL